jgi:hypothetical protein
MIGTSRVDFFLFSSLGGDALPMYFLIGVGPRREYAAIVLPYTLLGSVFRLYRHPVLLPTPGFLQFAVATRRPAGADLRRHATAPATPPSVQRDLAPPKVGRAAFPSQPGREDASKSSTRPRVSPF